MQLQENFSLAKHNTLGLDISTRYFCRAHCQQELSEVLAFAREEKLRILVLGGGSNIVFTKNFDGLVLMLDFRGVQVDGQKVTVGAGENWHWLVRHTLQRGLFGLENLSLIPGLAGAAPIQNIGAYGQELDQVFVELEATDLSTGEEINFTSSDCCFGYRHSIFKDELKDRMAITHITLRLCSDFTPILNYQDVVNELESLGEGIPTATDISDAVIAVRKRKLPNPDKQGNVGSFFKNPEMQSQKLEKFKQRWPDVPSRQLQSGVHKIPAAWLIEKAGMKGMSIGDAAVSTLHALVIVNRGNASSGDVLGLGARVEKQVLAEFGIRLEIEPVFY
ncbi:MAG: UDP-N-acetylmuramate dehydrogenase [Gammaproteobacteria bacterium]|nr:UDP-N-acetylmuramate dehydrogenase [Gammaproteobacteria bacterium]